MNLPKTYLRYLPAEGEIKKGDFIIAPRDRSVVGRAKTDLPKNTTLKKVERYAVTTEISEGDEIWWLIENDGQIDGWHHARADAFLPKDGMHPDSWGVHPKYYGDQVSQDMITVGEAYKILAPISPAVTWEIEDGAEIEVKCQVQLFKDGEWLPLGADKNIPFARKRAKVKGPCGHYH